MQFNGASMMKAGLNTHRSLMLLLILVASSSLQGCSNKTSDRDISLISPVDADAIVQGKSILLGLGGTTLGVWLDPRSERDFRQGHIPGAVNLPFQNVANDHHILKEYEVIVVYGSSYNDPKANAMSKRLMQLGYKDVKTLRGGLSSWKAAGYDIEEGE